MHKNLNQYNVIAIIQARMGSSRFPGKVLEEFCGMPMLAVLLHRLGRVKDICEIVVATTNEFSDDPLVDWLKFNKINYYRGSQNDVLARYWNCAKKFGADIIVRVTADDPLKDPEVIARALLEFNSNDNVDYVSNTINPSFPEGLDIEVFSFEALDLAYNEAKLLSEREHVTPYIWKNPDKFSIRTFGMDPNLSAWRWTVDKPADLIFLQKLLSYFEYNINTSYTEFIKFLLENPEMMEINSGTVRNEGYLKSISMEKNE